MNLFLHDSLPVAYEEIINIFTAVLQSGVTL